MYDDRDSEDDAEQEFWSRVPDRPLDRLRTGRGTHPTRSTPIVRHSSPRPAGSRTHHDDTGPITRPKPIAAPITQAIPVIAGTVRDAGRHIDPLMRRLGVAALIVALAVPVAMALRSDPSAGATQVDGTATSVVAAPAAADSAAADTAADGSVDPWAAIDVNALPEAVPVNPDPVAQAEVAASATPSSAATKIAVAAASDTAARTVSATVPANPCGAKYTIRPGDAWSLIASRAKVSLRSLLAVNNATTATVLFAGNTICLPVGATMPSSGGSSTGTTTKPTTTTTKPKPVTTTTAPKPPRATYTRAQVEQIIRNVWPDNLEDKAIRIATRESNLNPNVNNYCCYGLFQIYYKVHRGWLANIGVTSAAQLYDPKTNAFAAYVLYLRSGSFAPWGG